MGKDEKTLNTVHVGFPKCASTFLQENVFGKSDKINRLPKRNDKWNNRTHILGELVYGIGSSHFNRSKMIGKFKNYIDENSVEGKINILSWEALSGPTKTLNNDKIILNFLNDCIKNIKIIVVYRNQYSFLYSCWADLVRAGHTFSLKRFLMQESKEKIWRKKYRSVYKKVLYDKYTKSIIETCGKENTKVLLLEDLKDDPKNFVEEIESFIGTSLEKVEYSKKRVSFDPLSLFFLRNINKITETRRETGPLPEPVYWRTRRFLRENNYVSSVGKFFDKRNVKEILDESIVNDIKKSNRELSRILSRDLSDVGYDI